MSTPAMLGSHSVCRQYLPVRQGFGWAMVAVVEVGTRRQG